MGPALRQAADELPDEGARNVVLVSDGLDTCAPPPVCDVAKELHEQGIDLIINTVGFLVDDEARTELECIAEAGGGRYLDANDADSLAESMRVLHTRSINAYETDLEEYEGSDSETTPTEIPADVDTFSSPLHYSGAALNSINGDAQYWRVPVEEGERLAISALTVQPPSFGGLTDNRYGMSLEFDDSSCLGDTWSQVEPNSAQGTQTAAGITKITGEDCGADGYVDFSISRRGNFLKGQDIPLELKITRFAGEDTSDVPDPEEESEVPEIEIPDDTVTAQPGTWFDDAAELPDGNEQGVSADIVPGETHFYKVPVEYGQRLAAAIATEGTDVEGGRGISVDRLDIKVYNEARQPAMNSEGITLETESSTTFGHAAPLNYRNIEDGTVPTRMLFQDGSQYISVNYNRLSNSDNEEVGDGEQHTARYSLAAVAEGEPQPGPTFREKSSDSPDAAGAKEPSDSSDPATESVDAAASSEGMGVTTWALIALAVLVIAGIVGGFIAKTRKTGTK